QIPAHPVITDTGKYPFQAPIGQLSRSLRRSQSCGLSLIPNRPGRALQLLEFLLRQFRRFRRESRRLSHGRQQKAVGVEMIQLSHMLITRRDSRHDIVIEDEPMKGTCIIGLEEIHGSTISDTGLAEG